MVWFSNQFQAAEFLRFDLLVDSNAQKDITAYQALAHIALLFTHCVRGARMTARLASLTDGTGAEGVSNRLYT